MIALVENLNFIKVGQFYTISTIFHLLIYDTINKYIKKINKYNKYANTSKYILVNIFEYIINEHIFL